MARDVFELCCVKGKDSECQARERKSGMCGDCCDDAL